MKISTCLLALLVSQAALVVDSRRRPNRQRPPKTEKERDEDDQGNKVQPLPERFEGNCDYNDIDYGSVSRLLSIGSANFLGWDTDDDDEHAILTRRYILNFRWRSDMRLEVSDDSVPRNCIEVIDYRGGQVLVEPCDCFNPQQIFMMVRVPQTLSDEYILYNPSTDFVLASNGGRLDAGDPRDLEDLVLSNNEVWSIPRQFFRS